jgi:hypothetical protein
MVDHLFFNSMWSIKAWNWFTSLFNIPKNKYGNWKKICTQFLLNNNKKESFKLQKYTICSLLWHIWTTRCKIRYDNNNTLTFTTIIGLTTHDMNQYILSLYGMKK